MPAATRVAPAGGAARSITATRAPADAARQAQHWPTRPAPTTIASKLLCPSVRGISPVAAAHGSLRRHYPDQVQTVGGAVAALSARGFAGSRAHRCYPSASRRDAPAAIIGA